MLHFRKLSPMYLVIDLNLDQVKSMLPRDLRKELLDECWPIDLFTTGGLSSCVRVSPMRCPLQGRTVAQLYRSRWQVELFFKWIKQHLRIKKFYGTSANALKTQIWIAISVYVLVAIVKKQLKLE